MFYFDIDSFYLTFLMIRFHQKVHAILLAESAFFINYHKTFSYSFIHKIWKIIIFSPWIFIIRKIEITYKKSLKVLFKVIHFFIQNKDINVSKVLKNISRKNMKLLLICITCRHKVKANVFMLKRYQMDIEYQCL